MSIRSFCLAQVFAATSLAFAVPVAATNLVLNPDFDTSLISWMPSGPGSSIQPTWNALDVSDDPDSGSAQVRNIAEASGQIVWLRQCRPVQPGYRYWLSGWVRRHTSFAEPGGPAYWAARWSFATPCSGYLPGTVQFGPSPSSSLTWVLQGPLLVQAPVTALAIEIRATVVKPYAAAAATAWFDAVEVRVETLFANGFQ